MVNPQQRRRGLQQTQKQIGHFRRGVMFGLMKFLGSLQLDIDELILKTQSGLNNQHIQNQDLPPTFSQQNELLSAILHNIQASQSLPITNHSKKVDYQLFHSQFMSILRRFQNQPVSFLSKLNSCSSSLLSLSNSASFRDNSRMHSRNNSTGPIFRRHIFKIHRVYLNLRDNLLVLSKTTINLRPLALQRVARQGPAVAVTPVFTPSNPGRLSSLFVFSHTTSRFTPSFSVQQRNCLQLMTSRKTAKSRHFPMRILTSYAVLPFWGWGSPWGLAKTEFRMPTSAARRFMQLMKPRSPSPRRQLPHLARARAASLPLGSMRAQNSWVRVQRSPSYSSAEVPVISAALASIWTIYLSGLRENCRQMRMAVQKVMILVRLAISTTFFEQYPVTTWLEGCYTTMKLYARMPLRSFWLMQNSCLRGGEEVDYSLVNFQAYYFFSSNLCSIRMRISFSLGRPASFPVVFCLQEGWEAWLFLERLFLSRLTVPTFPVGYSCILSSKDEKQRGVSV